MIARSEDFRAALLAWYRRHARRLPWRETPSLYRTVVSEFMLQQTQVKTVLPYFARWLAALPDFAALAAAPEGQVLKLWEGLGYYTRARNLHRLARELAARPAPPTTPEAWRELPGIGPYTAAAITSISFGTPAAVVDGNVVRVLARLTADASLQRDGSAAARAFAPLASALLDRRQPGDHNQAMMELGATVCLRQGPLCPACPVRPFCAVARRGDPASYPRLAARRTEAVTVVRAWCRQRDRLLLHRTPRTARRLAEQHELPTPEQLGLKPEVVQAGALLARKRRAITRYRITEPIHAVEAPANLPDGLVWVPVAEIESVTLSGPHRRWVRELLAR
ncbi:MAG: A/G-specific adenine glycosylase [Opitutales bacterium]